MRAGELSGSCRRYRACGITFNALTGTSLRGLRHRDKWLGHAEAPQEGPSALKSAAGIQLPQFAGAIAG